MQFDDDQRGAYRSLEDVVTRAAWGRPDAEPAATRVLAAFERALISGACVGDDGPWPAFVAEIRSLVGVLESGPLPKFQSGWIAPLRRIAYENRDLLAAADAEAVRA